MASAISAAPTSAAYAYQRGSATATRNLVDSSATSPIQSGTATPSDPSSPHATLHRRKTNHYETALADRLNTAITTTTTEGPTSVTNMTNDPSTTTTNDDDQPQSQSDDHVHATASGPRIVGTVAYKGDAAAAQTPGWMPARPGLGGAMGRQQSWKQGDQKRGHMERMLSSDDVAEKRKGYSSSSATGV